MPGPARAKRSGATRTLPARVGGAGARLHGASGRRQKMRQLLKDLDGVYKFSDHIIAWGANTTRD